MSFSFGFSIFGMVNARVDGATTVSTGAPSTASPGALRDGGASSRGRSTRWGVTDSALPPPPRANTSSAEGFRPALSSDAILYYRVRLMQVRLLDHDNVLSRVFVRVVRWRAPCFDLFAAAVQGLSPL